MRDDHDRADDAALGSFGVPVADRAVYLYCIAAAAVLLYVPGFIVAAYGRLQVGYDFRQPRTMLDRVPAYARLTGLACSATLIVLSLVRLAGG